MKYSHLCLSTIVGVALAQELFDPRKYIQFDPRIPKDCSIFKPCTRDTLQFLSMLASFGGLQVGPEEVPQNGTVPPGSGKIKGRRCAFGDSLICMVVTPENYDKSDATWGNGRFLSSYYNLTDPNNPLAKVLPLKAFPAQVLYYPLSPPDIKLPVIILNHFSTTGLDPTVFPMLIGWAAHGFAVFVTGVDPSKTYSPQDHNEETTRMKRIVDAVIDLAASNESSLDTTRIGVAGIAYGGRAAHEFAHDSRVKSLAMLTTRAYEGQTLTVANSTRDFKTPSAFFMGERGTTQSKLTEKEFEAIPAGVPKWKGILNTGDFGTYCQPYGGQFGIASTNWWKWTLQGDSKAGEYFTKSGATNDGWQVFWEDLESFKVPNPLTPSAKLGSSVS
ncbi:hypothetical protein BT63DRAFT_309339 [Microthyrium microscopicum]|uniref:Alpha/beta-hydrolase n=1 Tax=Microthyrium microscopicum TaxID=703497 RepID=A0A6A6U809_9PEZI|nr:hypothetical protein BT63DRAFT_309339 [Microthyrium microscopicum]